MGDCDVLSLALESTLELYSTTLRQTKQRIRPLFAAPSVAASANAFLDGLLGGERRKTGWMRAEAVGDPGPWRQQAILGRTHWDGAPCAGRGRPARSPASAPTSPVANNGTARRDQTGARSDHARRRRQVTLTLQNWRTSRSETAPCDSAARSSVMSPLEPTKSRNLFLFCSNQGRS